MFLKRRFELVNNFCSQKVFVQCIRMCKCLHLCRPYVLLTKSNFTKFNKLKMNFSFVAGKLWILRLLINFHNLRERLTFVPKWFNIMIQKSLVINSIANNLSQPELHIPFRRQKMKFYFEKTFKISTKFFPPLYKV